VTKKQTIAHIAVAPMMDWTDRHCRYFHRLLNPHAWLYTEMVTTGALLHGDRDRHLRFSPQEHPVALQLGGSDPKALADCARMGEDYGYDEINLNCGCPSDRVQNGRFGACLMAEPQLVAECVAAMKGAVSIPVTVKCRTGIDDCDEKSFLYRFVETVSKAGCDKFIIHARKAWLKGLSPKENREIPPLNYNLAYHIKKDFQNIEIIINGGISSIAEIRTHLPRVDGVMIGREAYQNPWILNEISKHIHDDIKYHSRETLAMAMIPYIEDQNRRYGTPAKTITRHMLGLFNGLRGARSWRRILMETQDIEKALAAMGERKEAA
jgi:tRNA-dihydrouridine synthase A